MQDAMFSGLFGALTTEHRMNFIANNLANVNTHGYKRDTLAFSDTMAYYAHDEIREPLMTVRSKPLFPEPKRTFAMKKNRDAPIHARDRCIRRNPFPYKADRS